MRYPFLFAVLLFCLAASCNNKNKGYHLSRKEMSKILLDMHIAEAMSNMPKKDSLHPGGFIKNYDSLARYSKEILVHYKLTQEQFDESLNWYKQRPDEMDSVYVLIQPGLNKLEAKTTK